MNIIQKIKDFWAKPTKHEPDYMRMFVDYCQKYDIWFSVYGNGSVDECTDTIEGVDFYADAHLLLGSKQAYNWLLKEHQEVQALQFDRTLELLPDYESMALNKELVDAFTEGREYVKKKGRDVVGGKCGIYDWIKKKGKPEIQIHKRG